LANPDIIRLKYSAFIKIQTRETETVANIFICH